MSALRDLLSIEAALGGGKDKDLFTRYLMKQLSKIEKRSGEDKKKQEESKKGKWTIEDRICLGLLLAFAAIPVGGTYLWFLRSLVRQ